MSQTQTLADLARPLSSERHRIPSLADFYTAIQHDQLDAEMGTTSHESAEAHERVQAKLWRALRSSSGAHRFHLCERIDNGRNLRALIEHD